MPLRCAASPLARQCLSVQQHHAALPSSGVPFCQSSRQRQRQRPFHSTRRLCDEQIDNARNHYEILKLQPGATPADIKKSFYTLSKTHHPDLHRATPGTSAAASRRFMRISEAYSVLSVPAKRAAYDRDALQLHQSQSQSPHGHHRAGSYHSSSNPAGGRPASGLSRRRGTFTGPPPSFFRSGGWGGQGAKRRAAHEESTGGAESSSSTSTSGGMGPGQDPYGHQDDVPHFDREGHERTGRHGDRRRASRRARMDGEQVSVEPERGMAGMFFAIGGILMLSFLGPFAVSRLWGGGGGKKKKAKS